jgi:hypothetical protein
VADVLIRITGQDGVSPVFKKIGAEATAMGGTVDAASKKSAAGMDEINKHAAALTSLLTTSAVRGMREFAAAGEQNSQAQRQLQQAIENTGHSWNEYATAIGKATSSAAQFGVSDDKATNALQSLTEITGSAANALNLLQVSEDIAAAKHMDLVTAAELVGRAYEGNTTMLTRYGIVLQQGASGTEAIAELQQRFGGQAAANTTLLAHYTAVFENWEGSMGAAMGPLAGIVTLLPGISTGYQIAATAGGALIDMFRAQKAAAAEAAAALEAESTAAATASAVTTGAGAAGEAGLLASLTGPAGIVAAIGAAAAGIYLLTRHTDEYRTAADAAATDTQKLATAIAQLQTGGGSPQAIASFKSISDQWTQLDVAAAKYQEALNVLATMPGTIDLSKPPTGNEEGWAKAAYEARAYVDQVKANHAELQAISKADEDTITSSLTNLFAHPGIDQIAAQKSVEDLFAQFRAGTIDADALAKAVSGLNDNWTQFAIVAATTDAATNALLSNLAKITSDAHDAWAKAVDPLKDVPDLLTHIDTSFDPAAQRVQQAANLIADSYKKALDAAAGDPAKIAAATSEYVRSMFALDDILSKAEAATVSADQEMATFNATMDYANISASQTGSSLDHLRAIFPRLADSAASAASGIHQSLAAVVSDLSAQGSAGGRTFVDAIGSAAATQAAAKAARDRAYNQMGAASISNGAAMSASFTAQTQSAAEADAAIQKYLNDLGMLPTFVEELGAAGNPMAALAAGATQATAALTSAYNVIIGGTDAIAQQSDQIFKWADDLIGAQGVASKLDDLVGKGLISGKSGQFTGNNDYANAQRAYNSIAADNAKIQDEILAIQAKQAPVLADLVDKEEQYLDKVRQLPAAEQTAALGFMDTTESMKAQNLVALAGQAAMGQLGDKGKESAQKIIEGAAAADPVLASMLESMGLISMGADGTITVNMPNGETIQTAIDTMTTSINNLVALEYLIDINADTSDFWDHVHGLDGTHVGSVWVDVLAAYSAPLLPYQDPNYGLYPAGANGITAMANGGTATERPHHFAAFARMASGGTVTLVGEHGPEFVNLVRGDQVTNAVATRSRLGGRGIGGSTYVHYSGPVYVQPSSGNLQDELYNSAVQRERRRG